MFSSKFETLRYFIFLVQNINIVTTKGLKSYGPIFLKYPNIFIPI